MRSPLSRPLSATSVPFAMMRGTRFLLCRHVEADTFAGTPGVNPSIADACAIPAFAGQHVAAGHFLITGRSRLHQNQVSGVAQHQHIPSDQRAAPGAKPRFRPHHAPAGHIHTHQRGCGEFGLPGYPIKVTIAVHRRAPMTGQDVRRLMPNLTRAKTGIRPRDFTRA